MNGIDAALFVALAVLLMASLAVGAFMAARSPTFWVGMGKALAAVLIPKITIYVTKRNAADIEEKMHECARRGGEWDNFKKRCR